MNKEIEARFLEVDKEKLLKKLAAIGAKDKGEVLLTEIIFNNKDKTWHDEGRFVRVRSKGNSAKMTYKHFKSQTIDGAYEIEFDVPSADMAQQFLESIGLIASRFQEKKRHTFVKDDVTIDIDTWPQVPTYVELEGPAEATIREVATELELDWSKAVFEDARTLIQTRYSIPVGKLKWFTFKRCE